MFEKCNLCGHVISMGVGENRGRWQDCDSAMMGGHAQRTMGKGP